MTLTDKKQICNDSRFIFLLVVLGIGVNIKYIFTDLCIDSTYQISMAYRIVEGDLLFRDMWEVHQTSAFLCAIFIKLYLYLFKTTTGIVIFIQCMSVLFDGAISYLIYKIVFKYDVEKNIAFFMAWVFFVVSPKDVPIAEFANMQIWFSMLLCLMLFLYDRTKKKLFIILAALSLCLTILSYPSSIIIFPAIIILFIYYKQWKEILIFAGVCLITGALYLGNILRYIKVDRLIETIESMLSIEPTHTVKLSDKFLYYAYDFVKYAIVLLVFYLISYVIVYFICKAKPRYIAVKKILTDVFYCLIMGLVSLYSVIDYKNYPRGFYSLSFVAIILVGIMHKNKIKENVRGLYLYGNLIAIMNMFATLLLTDLELITVIPYLIVAVIVALLPLSEIFKELNLTLNIKIYKYFAIILFIVLLVFKGVFIIRPMYQWIAPITDVRGMVKDGPAKGYISEYMGPYIQNETMKEWEEYVQEGDKIYLIGSAIDTLPYLYEDTIIVAPTVMSTPAYGESIAKYWEYNSEKYPDVVIAACWFGELDTVLMNNEWIMEWLEEDFKPAYYIDGKYWRYYFRE